MTAAAVAVPVRDARRALRVGALIALWVTAPVLAFNAFRVPLTWLGIDAHAYWLTAHHPALYGAAPHTRDAYLYAPAFAQAIRPLAELPFTGFYLILAALDLAAVAWLLAPLGWRWAVPVLGFCAPEFAMGNITGLLTVAVVLGVTGTPGALAFGWLTKITPGVLPATWLLCRGEWRPAARMIAVTASIAAVSFALDPSAWAGWVHLLTASGSSSTALPRLLAAVLLVVVGARRGWWWVLPVALLLGAPVPNLYNLVYLTALPRLARSVRPVR